jgi:hypothetical protein
MATRSTIHILLFMTFIFSAVDHDPYIQSILMTDFQVMVNVEAQPVATLPVGLDVVAPDIYVAERPAGGVLCSAMMWAARNLVQFFPSAMSRARFCPLT